MAPLARLLFAGTALLSLLPHGLALPGLGDEVARHITAQKATAHDGKSDGKPSSHDKSVGPSSDHGHGHTQSDSGKSRSGKSKGQSSDSHGKKGKSKSGSKSSHHNKGASTPKGKSNHGDKSDASKQPYGVRDPKFRRDLADPCLIFAEGAWYSFFTSSCEGLMPVATSKDFKTWTMATSSALNATAYKSGMQWGPDVISHGGGYLMAFSNPNYYDDRVKARHACIFTATGDSITGPFQPSSKPLICPHAADLDVIDPAFYQEGSKLYIVHKKSKLQGKTKVWTNIDLQPLNDAGDGLDGAATILLRNEKGNGDGDHNIEAPYIVLRDGIYFLTFSTHEYSGPNYNVEYATSTSLTGGYKRAKSPLLDTGKHPEWDHPGHELALKGPGGLSFASSGTSKEGYMVFHDLQASVGCGSSDKHSRTLWSGNVKFSKANGGTMSL